MPRIGINKQQVFKAAKEIAATGKTPTAEKVRNLLTTGSIATVQKYLRLWKKKCFIQANSYLSNEVIKISPLQEESSHDELLEKNRDLEQALNKQIAQNEHYVQELISTEKANIALKEENHQLESDIQKLQFELTEIKTAKNTLEQINKEIQNKLNINSNETIQKMQKTIDDLRLELKTLNETSINSLRETSNQGHEALMQERVVSINLQAKIDSLTKELSENKKQLHEAIMTAQAQNRSLLRQNEQLQKIIQEHGLDKLLQLEEGSSLQFTKGAAVYGK